MKESLWPPNPRPDYNRKDSMNNKASSKLINGYSISLVLHLLIILLGSLYVIKPHLTYTWHQFTWEMPNPGLLSENPAAQGVPQANSANSVISDSHDALATQSPLPASEASVSSQRIVESPIERPSASKPAATSSPGINRSLGSSALKDLGSNVPGGNMGFSSAMEPGSGDAYVIQQLKPQIVPTQDGEVLLEFRLSRQGMVVPSSVNVISFSSAAYVEAVRKVLPEWKFGFRKAYAADKVYRIRCRFITNE